jgi:hypothetical protein
LDGLKSAVGSDWKPESLLKRRIEPMAEPQGQRGVEGQIEEQAQIEERVQSSQVGFGVAESLQSLKQEQSLEVQKPMGMNSPLDWVVAIASLSED